MKQDKVKEQRLIEATHKEYLGPDGKIAVVLRNLGHPIMGHTSPFVEITEMEDPYALDDEGLPYFDESESTAMMGMMFDGLSRGIHMEIKQVEYQITVSYKGHKVFEENRGDLDCYVPGAWEGELERLYKIALPTEKENKKHSKMVRESLAEHKKNSWISEMKDKWGFEF
jgi:hypothetical protein